MLIIKSPWLHEDIMVWTLHHIDDTVIVRLGVGVEGVQGSSMVGSGATINHLFQYHDYMMIMMIMMMLRKRFKEVSVLRGRF